MASSGLGTGSASVTSMNFVGFEELKGQGAPELLYNQIFIEPNLPTATSSGNIAAGVRPRAAVLPKTAPHDLEQERAGPAPEDARVQPCLRSRFLIVGGAWFSKIVSSFSWYFSRRLGHWIWLRCTHMSALPMSFRMYSRQNR